MKKILFIAFCLLLSINVEASQTSSLFQSRVDGYYYERSGDDSVKHLQLSSYLLDNETAYCIEPVVSIKTDDYFFTEDIYGATAYSEEVIEKISLYAYYGYSYRDNLSLDYLAATQKLIWESVSNYKFEFYTENYKNGNYIDLSEEITEIQNKVDNHYVVPSFNNQNFVLQKGEVLEIEDLNSVLNNFDLIDTDSNITIDDNKIVITGNESGEFELLFKKKNYENNPTLIHYSSDSQKMITKGFVEDVYFSITYKVIDSSFVINKYGESYAFDNNLVLYTDVPLENVSFEIYALNDIYSLNGNFIYGENEYITSVTTNEDGQAVINDLIVGNYYMIEISTQHDHLLIDDYIYFDLELSDGVIHSEVNIYNKYKKGSFELFKYDVATGAGVPGTLIEVYTTDNLLVYSGLTNDDGYIKLDALPVGDYFYKEVTPAEGYVLNSNHFYFTITNDEELISESLLNEKIIEIPDTEINDSSDVIVLLILISSLLFSGGLYVYFKIYKK